MARSRHARSSGALKKRRHLFKNCFLTGKTRKMGTLGKLFSNIQKKKAGAGSDKSAKLAKASAATKGKRGNEIQARRTGVSVAEVKAGKKKKPAAGLKKGSQSQLGKGKGKGKLGAAAKGKGKGKKGGKKAEPAVKKSAEELDADLESYYKAKAEAAPAV